MTKVSFTQRKPEFLRALNIILNESIPYRIWTTNELVNEVNQTFSVQKRLCIRNFHFLLVNNQDWLIFKCDNAPGYQPRFMFVKKKED